MMSAFDFVDVRAVGPHLRRKALLGYSFSLRGASGVSRAPVSPTAFRVLRLLSDGHVAECCTPFGRCQGGSTLFHLCKPGTWGKVSGT